MGCGGSAQIRPLDAAGAGVVPGSGQSIKLHAADSEAGALANCSPVDRRQLQLLLEKPLTDTETFYFDYVQKLVVEYKRRSAGPDAFHLVEQALVGGVLEDCIFVGHVKTDLDSIGGAIGAAALFGGTAAKSEDDLNGEITYALQFSGLEAPTHFDLVPGGGEVDSTTGKYRGVCLVDHNEEKQMTKKLRECPSRKDRIIGLIDHHAMSEAFCTERPLFVDVRPWGSMSTIVSHTFVRESIPMTKAVARILLCAILSDTLDLRSVTTTRADRLMVGVLAVLGELESAQAAHDLAAEMFRAKTQWIVSLGAKEMVRGDQKDFTANGWRLGISVLEVTCPDEVYAKVSDIAKELQALKLEKGQGDADKELHFAFCFIVDVTQQRSDLILCGEAEHELAQAAFPQGKLKGLAAGLEENSAHQLEAGRDVLMDVGGLVSRKSQFAPALLKTLNDGFALSADIAAKDRSMNDLSVAEIERLVDDELGGT